MKAARMVEKKVAKMAALKVAKMGEKMADKMAVMKEKTLVASKAPKKA